MSNDSHEPLSICKSAAVRKFFGNSLILGITILVLFLVILLGLDHKSKVFRIGMAGVILTLLTLGVAKLSSSCASHVEEPENVKPELERADGINSFNSGVVSEYERKQVTSEQKVEGAGEPKVESSRVEFIGAGEPKVDSNRVEFIGAGHNSSLMQRLIDGSFDYNPPTEEPTMPMQSQPEQTPPPIVEDVEQKTEPVRGGGGFFSSTDW